MYSTVNVIPRIEPERKYPYLGKSKDSSTEYIYVLFYKKNCGTVVFSTKEKNQLDMFMIYGMKMLSKLLQIGLF